MCDACSYEHDWVYAAVFMCLHECVCVCVRATGAVYICIGCLLHCRRSVPTGEGTASRCDRLISWRTQTSKSALCLMKHCSSRIPVIINRGAEIINESQFRRAMTGSDSTNWQTFPSHSAFLLPLLLFVSVSMFRADCTVSYCTGSHSPRELFLLVIFVCIHMVSEVIRTTLESIDRTL